MRETKTLEALCQCIEVVETDWPKKVKKFKSHKYFKPENKFSFEDYRMFFSETYLDVTLDKLSAIYPSINLKPFKSKEKTKSYSFQRSPSGRTFVRKHYCPLNCGEYDNIISIGDKTVVFEVKVGKWENGIRQQMKPKTYNKKLKPIKELAKNISYVMLIPPEEYNIGKNGPIFNEFINQGNIVIPFYTSKKEFEKDLIKNLNKYKLKIKS